MFATLSNTTSNIMNKLSQVGGAGSRKEDELGYLKPRYVSNDENNRRILKEVEKFKELTKEVNDIVKGLAIEGVNLAAWWEGYTSWFVMIPASVFTYYHFLTNKDYSHVMSRYFDQMNKLYQIYVLCGKDFTNETANNAAMLTLLETLYPVVEYRHLRHVWSKDSIQVETLPKQFLAILEKLPHRIDPHLKGNGLVDNSVLGMGQQLASSMYLKLLGLSADNVEEIIKNIYGPDSQETATILAEMNRKNSSTQINSSIKEYVDYAVKEGYGYAKRMVM